MAVIHPKAVLIAGGAKRLGRAAALVFAESGYDVALHYHHSEEEASATATAIQAIGRRVAIYTQDLSKLEELPEFMARVKGDFPHLTTLVHAAAVFEPQAFHKMTLEAYRHQMAINLDAPLWLAHAFANQIGKGTIIQFLDNYTHKHQTRFFSYLLSKKALEAATQMLAANLGPNIRVHGVAPGVALPSPGFDEDYIAGRIAKTPLQRITSPEDIARTLVFLAEAEHLTGQIMMLDSGEWLCW